MVRRIVLTSLLLGVLVAPAAKADPPSFALGGANRYDVPKGPLDVGLASRAEPAAQPVPREVVTVPTWQYLFPYGGQLWGSLMVGTDPAAGSATTTVPVTIVPLRLTFARDGSVLDAPGMAEELAASSLFTPAGFVTGYTQYGDAYRRGDFWEAVGSTSPGYHTLLGGPTIARAQRWTVPASKGLTVFYGPADRRFGYVDGDWFSHQLEQTIAALRIDPRSFVIFLAYNTEVAYQGTPDSCFTPAGCSLFAGVHGALINGDPRLEDQPPRSVNTYAYASFRDLGQLIPPGLNLDEHLEPISHEILEWLDDPIAVYVDRSDPFGATFAASDVPSWTSPYYAFGCSPLYEVADPLERGGPAIGVPRAGRIDVLANAVFHPWFARTASTSIFGLYDMGGVFQSYSQPC